MRQRLLLALDLIDPLRRAGLADVDALFDLGGDAERTSVVSVVERAVDGTNGRFHLKRYLYPGWAKARHLIGRGTLGGIPPELNEFLALERLRALGLSAVKPLAAAARWHGRRLAGHVLLTEHWPGALDLGARLADSADPLATNTKVRRRVLRLLATDVARMHAADFVHGDLHARNILVGFEPEPTVVFLDCRRGGTTTPYRRPLRDLAALALDLEGRVSATDRGRMLRAYLSSGADPRATCRTVRRARDRLARRLARKGRPLQR